MRDTSTVALLLGVLLAATFTCFGLMSLWAATSRRPWAVRVAVVAMALATLLLIPAYEPLLALSLQVCLVVAGVKLWQRRLRPQIRFSLKSLLLCLMPIVAAFATIAGRTAPQGKEGWVSILLCGFVGSCAVLLGAWMLVAKRRPIAWPEALLLSALIGLLVAWQDWFVLSTLGLGGWPPDVPAWQSTLGTGGAAWLQVNAAVVWSCVTCGITLLVCLTGSLSIAAKASSNPKTTTTGASNKKPLTRRRFAHLALATLLLLIAAFPGYVMWRLLRPSALPSITPLESNGRDDIVAAGQAFQLSPILSDYVYSMRTTAALKAEIDKHAAAYARLRDGLAKPIRIHDWQSISDSLESRQEHRLRARNVQTASRGLNWAAELARREGRYGDVVKYALENFHLAQSIAQDGTLMDWLVAREIERTTRGTFYAAAPNFDAETWRRLIGELSRLDQQPGTLEDAIERDIAWGDKFGHWSGRVLTMLHGEFDSNSSLHRHLSFQEKVHTASNRMLIVDLAIRVYTTEHGAPPTDLNQLSPALLKKVPVDPFDPAGGPVRYRRTETGYLIYSVFDDGHDNDGLPAQGGVQQDVDLRLDQMF